MKSMEPTSHKVYSPDDGGYYYEFWDSYTGKDLVMPSGNTLTTGVHSQGYRASKMRKRIMRLLANPNSTLSRRVKVGYES